MYKNFFLWYLDLHVYVILHSPVSVRQYNINAIQGIGKKFLYNRMEYLYTTSGQVGVYRPIGGLPEKKL